jgi:hypothetical protein
VVTCGDAAAQSRRTEPSYLCVRLPTSPSGMVERDRWIYVVAGVNHRRTRSDLR